MDRESGFISVDDSRWSDALRRISHDVYHLPAYAILAAESVEGAEEVTAFYWQDGERIALIPLIIKACPSRVEETLGKEEGIHWCDAVSPYGYGGPITNRPGECEAEVLSALREAAEERGILTLFLRAHPLLSSAFQSFDGDGSSEIGTTYSVPLPSGDNAEELDSSLLARYRSSHRAQIHQLHSRHSIQLVIDDWRGIEDFGRVYRATMERLGATASYLFTDRYFVNARDTLSGSFHLVSALSEGEYLGGIALFTSGDIVQYHLAATADEWRALGLSKLLIHHAALWAAQQGYTTYHLGGGVGGGDDSLSHFKRGFGSVAHPFRVYKVVVNEGVYQTLLTRLPGGTGDFFPPYCAPAVGG